MNDERVTITTKYGEFQILLDHSKAPAGAGYFRQLFASGALEGSTVFRIVNGTNGELRAETPIHVIQLGWADQSSPHVKSIAHEPTVQTGLTHKKWSISVAREGVGENYASFFICMRDEPELDFGGARHPDGQGFAVFGEVVSGHECLIKIFSLAEPKEYLTEPILVESIRLAPLTKGEKTIGT